MKRNRRIILIGTLGALGLLAVLSLVGAFHGATWAGTFFSSPPLIVFWLAFTALLVVGFVAFPRLRRQPGLLLMHLGCLAVLLGAMWGSPAGHDVQRRLLHNDKVPEGWMLLHEGKSAEHIMSQQFRDVLAELPFALHLDDFRMDYYADGGSLAFYPPGAKPWAIPAVPGTYAHPGEGLHQLEILQTFKNMQVSHKDGKAVISEGPDSGYNPALEVQLTWPDGSTTKRFIFARFPHMNTLKNHWTLNYSLPVRDYYSDLVMEEDGEQVGSRTIEVNHPLHYGGYYFYQASYDPRGGHYSILSVTSDSGYPLLILGFWLLGIGCCWHCWITPLLRTRRRHGN